MRLAFSSTVVFTLTDFEHAVAQIRDSLLLDVTGLVLRVDARLWLELTSTTEIAAHLQAGTQAVARRTPGIAVYAMPDGHSCAEGRPGYAARHAPRLLSGPNGATANFLPVDAATTQAIRDADLAVFIEEAKSRCLICAASTYHFALPSGAHASQFLRLAEAFVDIETVDRIAYWVALEIQAQIPPLCGDQPHTLIVDHPSMLILASRVQLLVTVPLKVIAFPTYPSDVETRAATFDMLKQVSSRTNNIFVLIGVASTGRMAQFIKNWAQSSPTHDVRLAILYSLCDVHDVATYCRLMLPDYQHFAPAEQCGMCAVQSHPVSIQTSNYMVGYGPATAVVVPSTVFEQQRAFLELWGSRPGVLRVHYDDPNEPTGRHHAFYIDVGTLLDEPDFEQEIGQALAALRPLPNIVAVPEHRTAQRLGALAARLLNAPLLVMGNSLLQRGEGAVDAQLSAATCVLVLDDVFITGQRIDVFNRFFRERRASHAPNIAHLHYWTVLATPSSSSQYARRVTGITRNHGWQVTLGHLYRIPLPDWHLPSDCPWCREQSVLNRLAQSAGDIDGPLAGRLTELANKSVGVSHAPFFLAADDQELPGLGAQSALMREGASPLQVLFACASGVQQLRQLDRNPLNADQFPAPSQLAVRTFANLYSERLIWLGLLRALKGNELELALKRFLRDAALDNADQQRPIVHAELAVAWLTGKLDAIEASVPSRDFFDSIGVSWQSLFENGLVDRTP